MVEHTGRVEIYKQNTTNKLNSTLPEPQWTASSLLTLNMPLPVITIYTENRWKTNNTIELSSIYSNKRLSLPMSIHCHSLSSSTSNEIYFYFDILKVCSFRSDMWCEFWWYPSDLVMGNQYPLCVSCEWYFPCRGFFIILFIYGFIYRYGNPSCEYFLLGGQSDYKMGKGKMFTNLKCKLES